MAIRIDCPDCRQRVAMSSRGRLARHGTCARSGRHVGRIWPAKWRGRRVVTIPGPDTWNPNALEGAA